jgi:antitoxin (DNA-binding transcriptional repressor) of toxin-antitoxin stability system
MAQYSVAKAKDALSSLIAKAEAGEEVIITRHGKPAVELRVIQSEGKPLRDSLAWLRARRGSGPEIGITALELKRLDQADYER